MSDLNGDGIQDLAVVSFADNNVSVLQGNGDGTFNAATYFGAGSITASLAIADFNGDGKPDLAVVDSATAYYFDLGHVSVLINNTARPD